MPRPRLAPGEWGAIRTVRVESASGAAYRSRARFRGFDGRARVVERTGRSQAASQRALTAALQEAAEAAGAGRLSAQDTLEEAVRQWLEDLDQLVRMGERSPGTVQTYRQQWSRNVSPSLGGLRLGEITTPVVDRFLVDLHERVGSATSRTARAVISGAMGRAVREGAIRSNPTREVRRLSAAPRRRPRALTEQERAAWFLSVTRDPRAVSRDLPDLCAFMLATGLRLGEVVAVLWSEIDLEEGTVEVTSTLIRVTGQGLIRKATKSASGQRRLPLPQWCVAMLRRRADVGVGLDEPVFGTIDGGFREPRTVSRWLYEVRADSDLEWVTSHVWRKTTASILDGSGVTARIIADQLGHSRVSMTQDVYLGRGEPDPRVLVALEAANPQGNPPGVSGGQSGDLGGVRGGE
mgnify:CR=1 FL=1